MKKGTSKAEKKQESREMETRCWKFLRPFLEELHESVDRRLVKTLLDLVMVIQMHRNRNNGLLLSELGDHLLGGERGPAGVKRIASLLHSARWKSNLIVKYLWERANEKVKELLSNEAAVYVIWDESVLEKNESLKVEGLCAVRSSKAARLKRIKPGYFNPPTDRPIFVPGFNWLQILVTGLRGTPVLAHLCWWTTRGEKASQKRLEETNILKKVANLWGRKVIHAGIVALRARRGQHLHSIIACVSSCVGTTNTISLEPMDENTKLGKLYWGNVHGSTVWSGMPADAVTEKQASLPHPFICPMMNVNFFWSFLVQDTDASLGTSLPPNQSTRLNKPGRSSLPMPDVGRSRCPYVSPNRRWLLNPPGCTLGKLVSNSS